MRSALTTMVGMALFIAACGGTNNTTTTTSAASTSGSSATGGSASSGTSTGGNTTGNGNGATTGGSSTGQADGTACTSNAACGSGICGIDGTGNCCASACTTGKGPAAVCGAVGCDSTGTCVYPVADAGAILCSGTCSKGQLVGVFCDTAGGCTVSTGKPGPCTGNYACEDAATCKTTCTTLADCASGFYCNAGQCLAQVKVGACSENNACTSLVCDIHGSGNCCTAACGATSDQACSATTCDATSGACVYPSGNACGGPTCVNSKESGGGLCDVKGNCVTSPVECPNNLGCDSTADACNTSCTTLKDCASGFYCNNDAGGCIQQIALGSCFENDECTSGACGVAGSGNCCAVPCLSADPTCGATACDAVAGACNYPPNTAACGSIDASCTAGVGQPASACDGKGTCNATPAPVNCTPYICGATACDTTCKNDTSCATGDVCDTTNSACCAPIPANGTIAVDGTAGSDATPCCGYAGAGSCATITHAMQLIDLSQASGVTIDAKVNGGAGDWTVKTEVYPITLGWGVELNAPGVYFYDPQQSGSAGEIFDINFYSVNDTIGYASIVGTAAKPAGIGLNTKNDASAQSIENAMVQVESGNTLYIANVNLNSSYTSWANTGANSTAILVIGGGSLTVGQDQSAKVTGTVTIGNALNVQGTDGWTGIACTNNAGVGCTITDDATLTVSSLVIQGQENVDIDAEDYATITLKSAPVIGIVPKAAGFLACPDTSAGDNGGKPDAFSSFSYPTGAAVLLNGNVTMTFDNGTVACISGDGFLLQGSANGTPTLTMDSTTIENTEYGILATAGTATVTKSTIQFNYNGVQQGTDGTNIATVTLSGGGNTMICASSAESTTIQNSQFGTTDALTPGVDVLNTTANSLAADNSTWDTKVPDEFSCDSTLTTCTCESASCANAGGINGMNTVYTGAGTFTTTVPTQSKTSCGVPCGTATCTGAQICCPTWTCPFSGAVFCADSTNDCQGSPQCF